MDNLGEMRAALQSDLTVGAESALFDAATLNLNLNRAYRKIGAMFKWPDTKDSLKTSAVANHEYYDYPQNWRPNSIWKLTLDATDYGEPLTFKDYLYEKENSLPSGLQRMWANYGKRYFIYPIPTATGDKNIVIWGFKFVDKLTVDGDVTIFSYSMPNINEAIVLEALAICKNKGDIQPVVSRSYIMGATLLSDEAKNIVISEWGKLSQEEAKLQRTTPQWDVSDLFASGVNNENAIRNKVGNF